MSSHGQAQPQVVRGFGTQIVTDEYRLHLVSVLSGIPALPAR
jgi:hypothetical protein